MDDLIAKLKAATGPSRELDAEIWELDARDNDSYLKRNFARTVVIKGGNITDCPHYTESVDAALTLVPEGWRNYRIVSPAYSNGVHVGTWEVGLRHDMMSSMKPQHIGRGPTLALAICIAWAEMMKARRPT